MINALQHQRVSHRQPILAGLKSKGYSVKALFTKVSGIEFPLAAIFIIVIFLPLIYKTPLLGGRIHKIHIPEHSDAEHLLFQWLIPEELNNSQPSNLRPSVIQDLTLSTYQVKGGDTLSEIAQGFRLNLDTVISYNNIKDARTLKPGIVLQLPNTNGLRYRVKRGDYLGGIARKYGVPLNSLLDWNNLESSVIKLGQELFIPGARLSEQELNRVLGRLFIYPTRGRITSRFGMRTDPLSGVRRFHNGVDLANEVGTPIGAAMSGRVAMTGYNTNYGKYIILTHPEGFQTFYGHLESFKVRKGEQVKQGQIIGSMGNSGYSTGSHLHFSIFQKGEPVDPFRYLH